ncbi:MAG TPA: DUF1345 domain-containing protein [Casimicrobiaceae bacterium]|nr:DUF1345 domain-containing protein [Casimicrobiaceae bacterium]
MADESEQAGLPGGWGRPPRRRLISGLLVGLVTYALLLLATDVNGRLRFIAAWDVGAGFALAALYFGLRNSSVATIRRIAARQDAGKWAVLALCLLAAAASLVAIAGEMPQVKNATGLEQVARVVLMICTIVLSWAFMHSMFALHYAHDYYLEADLPAAEAGPSSERLLFPGEHSPTYGDFLYFSFTIGMTFQTSDVQIADPYIRRVVAAHGAVAFFYTTGILALMINLVAGLI